VEGVTVMEVSHLIFLVQRDIARASGRAMPQVGTSLRLIWLAQSKLLGFGRHLRLSLFTPVITFWPGSNNIFLTNMVRKGSDMLRQFMLLPPCPSMPPPKSEVVGEWPPLSPAAVQIMP